MNILITGIHGFVGSNLVKALAPYHTIYGVDIIAPEQEGVVRTYSWEELDRGEVSVADVVIHLAGKAHDTKNEAKAEVYFKEVRVFQYGEGGGRQGGRGADGGRGAGTGRAVRGEQDCG